MNILDVMKDMTPHELAGACTYERASIKNMFAEELCRRAGLLHRYQQARTDIEVRSVLDRAAKSFGIRLI